MGNIEDGILQLLRNESFGKDAAWLFHSLANEFPGLWDGETEVGGADLVDWLSYQISELDAIKSFVPLCTCKICDSSCTEWSSHLHDGGWVGECCWDERLRAYELPSKGGTA